MFPQGLFPQTLSSWIFLIVACLGGFLIGQWIRHRREKTEDEKRVYARMLGTDQKKRVSKKERRKAHRPSQ